MAHVYYLILIAVAIGLLGAYVTRKPSLIPYDRGRDEGPSAEATGTGS